MTVVCLLPMMAYGENEDEIAQNGIFRDLRIPDVVSRLRPNPVLYLRYVIYVFGTQV